MLEIGELEKVRMNKALRQVWSVIKDGENHTIAEMLRSVKVINPRATKQHITVYVSSLRFMFEPLGFSILYTKSYGLGNFRLVRLIASVNANSQE